MVVAGLVLVAVVGYAVLVPLLAGPEAGVPDLRDARFAPGVGHWFGTDASGYDLFVRAAAGLRTSLLVALACAVTSTLLGVLVGTVAATVGGRVDSVLMRLADAVNALPHLLLGIVVVALFRGSLTAIIASIVVTHWPPVARLVRSEALSVRAMEYVDSAYLFGARRRDVLRVHVLPATLAQAVIAMTLILPHAIWHESALSFLGLGLSPDQASLGTLLALSRGEVLTGSWWTLVFPALLLVLVTLAVARLGTGAQTRLAPSVDAREVLE
ncbi:MAG: ABC transporter permease [Dermatophilus congolensis]|nr:ABC transporter permease [Dermatophilus congolensis]